MNNQRLLSRAVALGVVVAATAVVGLSLLSRPSVANARPMDATNGESLLRTITVVGQGEITIKPDVARASIGVETVQPTVQEASSENKQQIEAVIAALLEQGVERRDIQTAGLSIWAERIAGQGPQAETTTLYHVNNSVQVKLRDLDTVGETLDAAIEAGANNMYGVEFSLEDPSLLEAQARKAAIADAEAKAEELAALNGLAVGKVISISEIIGAGGYYSGDLVQAPSGLGGGGGGVPVSPGELKVIMQIQVSYEIAEVPADADAQPVLSWRRVGGIAGLCDDLAIYDSGEVQVSACGGSQESEPVQASLTSDQLAVLTRWQDTYQSFEHEQTDEATADGMTVQLTFRGAGQQVAQELDFALMSDFAQSLYNEEILAASEPPANCLTPASDQQLLVDEANAYCLLYPAAYSLLYAGTDNTELVVDSLLNHIDPRVSITVRDAQGQTLAEVTDQLMVDYVPPGWEVEPGTITLDGVEAVMLDDLPGQDLNRRVAFIQNGRLYSFFFSPLGDEGTSTRRQAEALYQQVLDSFRFLEETQPMP